MRCDGRRHWNLDYGGPALPAQHYGDDDRRRSGNSPEKLRQGEIAAVALVAGKPEPIFCELIGENGLYLLAIPPGPATTAASRRRRFTAADYPGFVPHNQLVDTVAVGAMLAVANLEVGSERYRNALISWARPLPGSSHFTHPAIIPSDLTAELAGRRRFPPAEQ